MTTKYDIGQKVLVEATITEIAIKDYGDKEKYKVQVGDGWGVWVPAKQIKEQSNDD